MSKVSFYTITIALLMIGFSSFIFCHKVDRLFLSIHPASKFQGILKVPENALHDHSLSPLRSYIDAESGQQPDWTSCESNAVYQSGGFMFFNNRWGGGKGCISVKREGDAITYWTTHDSNSSGNVTEAPLASIGSTWHGWAENKSLPRKLKDIEELRINWKVSLPHFEEGRRFVIYLQFYLNDTGDGTRPNGDIGMIFYREGFEFEKWGKNEGDHQIGNLTWTFVDKPTGGFGKYIMLAPNPALKLSNNVLEIKNFDIAPLLRFMVDKGYYSDEKYLVHLSTSMESIIIKGTIKHLLQEFKLVARNEKEPIYTPYWIGDENFRE